MFEVIVVFRLYFIFSLLTLSCILNAYDDDIQEDVSSWHGHEWAGMETDTDFPCECFCTIFGHYEAIGQSDFKSTETNCKKICLNEGEVGFNYTRFLSCYDAFSIGIGYQRTYIKWDPNPYFHKRNFNNIVLNIGGLTKRLSCWDWKGSFSALISTKEMHVWEYAQYQLSLWGRYQFCCNYVPPVGIHLGGIAKLGLEKSQLFPIVGVDFDYGCNWKFHLIYPVNISIEYLINELWSVEGAVTFWNLRHRVGRNEVESKGIFEYRNTGLNLGLNFDWCDIISANIHIGSTLRGGDLVVYDKHGRNSHHNKFKPAPYVGGDFMINF